MYLVNIDGLKHGWNEEILCSYPETNPEGTMTGYFPYPYVLPDGSGVIFCAGWNGPEHGIYLVEWPKGL